MSTLVKVIIIVAIVIVLGIVVIAGAGYYWWSKNGKQLTGATTEGEAFGKNTDNQGCLTEGLSRSKSGDGVTTIMSNTIFLTTCFQNSKPTPGFCDNVPKRLQITESAKWLTAKCAGEREKGSGCTQVYQAVQAYCESSHAR